MVACVFALFVAQAVADAHDDVTKAPRIPFSRGMGFIGYTSGTRTDLTNPATYTGLAAKGFDYVRLQVDFRQCSSYNSSTGVCTLNEDSTTSGNWWQTTTYLGFSSFDTAIDTAEAAGQYIILGFGNWNNMDPTVESQRAQFKATWRAVAERYANRSNRLVFELAEKNSINNADSTKISKFNSLQREAIAIIRETNPTRLILFSVADSSNPYLLTKDSTSVSPPTDDNNVAVSIACYNVDSIGWYLEQLALFKENRGIPVVLTEFNIEHSNTAHEDVTKYLARVTRFCEVNDIPWSPWMYYDYNASYFSNDHAKECCNSDGSLIDYVKAGLFPDNTTVDCFDPARYEKSMEITFSGYSGLTALTNFPVLVRLSEAEIYGFHYSDFKTEKAKDLCFTDAGGNLLAHEVDTWNPAGESTVWVKVPSLTAATKITAHYSCTNPVLPKVESVWDANYVGVWHMGEQKLPLADSSGVSRDMTSADGADIGYGSAGVVGCAVDFGAANSSRGVNADDHNALDGFAKITVEAWTKQSAHSSNAGIVSKRRYSGSSGSMSYYMYDGGDATTMCYSQDGGSVISAGVELQPVMGEWSHQAYTLDTAATSSNSKGYLNGALKGTSNVACSSGIFAGAGELHVGNLHSGNSANFPGSVDEVRISKCVRSADWIKASYDTVAKGRFATYEVTGLDGHNPTLYVDVQEGGTKSLDDELKEWTRRVVKSGEGTLVASPGTAVARLDVEGGTVKLASSAPASVASTLELASFASGTELDLSGKSYALAEIKGSPIVRNASAFTLNGGWTILGVEEMAVSGSLVFGPNANIVLANAALFEDVTHAGVAIATATGGITGMPTIVGDDFELRLSSDGKTLFLCSTIPDEPDWTAFSKSFTITFDGYGYTSTLVDFPVLVRLSSANVGGFKYSDFRKENGGDLRFSDSDGNLIPHEIDTWNPNGESTVWVKVPSLAWNARITAHYGCARPVRALDPKGVWSNGYAGVWHLGEAAPTLNESSGTAPGFTSSSGAGITYAVDGAVSGAVDFGDTGGGRRLDAVDHDSLDGFDAFTVEMWMYQTKHVTSGDRAVGLLSKRNKYDDQMSWFVHDNGSNLLFSVSSDGLHGTTKAAALISPELNAWQHVAFVYDTGATDGKYFKGYREGIFSRSNGQNAGRVFAGTAGLHLGCLGLNDSRNFPGRIDEVRISRVARSADWVKASHDTVADAAFATCSRVVSTTLDPNSQLVVYPEYPAGIVRDYAYGVTVAQGDTTTNLVVYNHCEKSALSSRTRGGDVNRRFCEFAFAGDPVRVDIRVCEDVQAYKVFPSRLRLQSTFNDGVISVWLDEPHSFGIQLNDYDKTILSVLVDRPENPADIPDRNDPAVLYVDGWMDPPDEHGMTYIDSRNSYTNVYIAPGAVLNSRIYIKEKSNVRVHGRGMILDPFSDIFRFDKFDSTNNVLTVASNASKVHMEDIKLVDARAYNYVISGPNAMMKNVKAISSMMCSDGISKYGGKFKMEGGWLYVGDNALVIGGGANGVFKDVVIGTSCKAIFPQGKNTNEYLEDIDVFRTDEPLIGNVYNPGTNELYHSFFFKNLSAVDCTLLPMFFNGRNMGTLPKTFGFENVCIAQPTGSSTWQSIGKKGKSVSISDDAGKPWTTCNYTLTITNLWVAGSRLSGFVDSDVNNPDRVSISVVNNLVAPKIPAVPNRKEVGWTCPWKRYIGSSLQRDVRLATPEAGEQHLEEADVHANLLADTNPTRSIWQASPSYQVKLGAKTFDTDGERIYRLRGAKAAGTGMYCDITDAVLRRGNGTYRLAFDVRAALITNGVDSLTIQAVLLSNEKTKTLSFTLPYDQEWHHYTADFETAFDMSVTELVGFTIKTTLNGASEINYKNLSLFKWTPEMDDPGYNRILYIPVAEGATTNLNAALVTEYITNIVKQGAGTLVASPIPDYAGDFEIEEGVYAFSNTGDFGKTGAGVIDVKDGASLEFRGGANNVLSGKTVNLYGAKSDSMNAKMVFSNASARSLGSNVTIRLKDADEVLYIGNSYLFLDSGTVDLGGRELRVKSNGNWKRMEIGATIVNGGSLVFDKSQFHTDGARKPTLSAACASTASLKFVNDAEMNWKVSIPSNGWTLYCDASTVRGNTVRFPGATDYPAWDGPVAFTNSSKVANWTGGYTVSNTVFNLKGAIFGSGTLAAGPGWLNLHSADNAYSGAVTVNGQSLASDNPILPGGGGIGLCNGASCFPDAKSVTFNNSSRLAFMDDSACAVGTNVVFAGGAGDLQSISGGVHTARSTIAGFRKTGAGTLLVDSPVSVTGTADMLAGTLKLANRINADGQTNAEMLAPMPVFASLSFASGTTLDLSDTKGYQVADISGSPVVTNAGLFGVTGKWTLASPNDVMTVSGDNPQLIANNAAGLLAFAEGATFAFKNAATEMAYSNAVVAAGSSGLVVARARGVMSDVNLGEVALAMPQPSGTSSSRWQMRVSDDNTTIRLFLVPESGYAAWVAEKGIEGSPDVKYNGIERAVRYAFDIDPASSTVGKPIIKVVRDEYGNPVVEARDLADGRDDVTFGVLATENLNDWGNATLVPMKKFATDGYWKPSASESSTYVFPTQMFFKYTIDVK